MNFMLMLYAEHEGWNMWKFFNTMAEAHEYIKSDEFNNVFADEYMVVEMKMNSEAVMKMVRE